MIETYSYTGDRLAREVEDKFGDTGNAQITRTMILSWINNGIRQISAQHDVLEGFASTNLLAGVAVYDLAALFAAQRIKSFESIVVAGRPVKMVPFSEYMGLITANDLTGATGTPSTGTVRGSALTLWPTPTETVAAGITLYYSAMPVDLAAITDAITLPDRFYNALTDYVVAQALELDENFEAAQIKMGQHDQALQREFTRNQSPTDFYTTITMDPYDDEGYIGGGTVNGGNTIVQGGYGSGGYGA